MSPIQWAVSDETILASAIIVDEKDFDAPSELKNMVLIFDGLSKYFGKKVHVVRWPNGFQAFVDWDPPYGEAWNNLLIAAYRQGLEGKSGFGMARPA